ncbi:MAG: MopE-related protein, partial [Bacteroidota bacterium]
MVVWLCTQPPLRLTAHPSAEAACGLGWLIPDNSCTVASHFFIPVLDAGGTQLGIDVVLEEIRIIIGHSWNADLDLFLITPSGVKVELSTDNGGASDNYGNPIDATCQEYTAFSNTACTSITTATPPFIGTYLPEGNWADFHDGSNPNGQWVLQICDDTQNDLGILQFVELVFSTSVCPPPTQLNNTPPQADAVAISWESGMNCSQTILEYGASGFVPGTDQNPGEGTVVSLNCSTASPFLLTGLDELTSYDVYLRQACGPTTFSTNSCVLELTTTCQTVPSTHRTSFDDQMACGTSCGTNCLIDDIWINQSNDQMDWLVDADGTTSTRTGPTDDISGGGQYIYIETSGGACQQNKRAILQSECMAINSMEGTCHLSFYYHMYGTNVNQLQLELSLDGGMLWTSIWSLTGDQGDEWQQAFVDLTPFDGQIALFRFVGKSGAGFRGDIALDEIVFYGPVHLGPTNQVVYADNDQDGFGNPNQSLSICAAFPPPNFVDNALDCNDNDPLIHPNASELPCNQIDENCNGLADDSILPNPIVSTDMICAGDKASLALGVPPVGQYYWFDAPVGGNLVHLGTTWETPVLTTTTTYYVQDSVFGTCQSDRVALDIVVHPVPTIFSNDLPVICQGTTFDLRTLSVEDTQQTDGTISFHETSPASIDNEIDPLVNPMQTASYIIRWQTPEGCSDEISIPITVDPKPTANIQVLGNDSICPTASVELLAQELGTANGNYALSWENGSLAPLREVFGATPGSNSTYRLAIIDEKGCTDTSTVEIHTFESINSVAVLTVKPAETCAGNDGAITLQLLNGIPPYTVEWSGPSNGILTDVQDTFRLEGLLQGAYQIRIRDQAPFACEMVLPNFIINGPAAIIDTVVHIQPISCAGAMDGGIDINVSGNNLDFVWSNGEVTEDLVGAAAGSYSVTISDGMCVNVLENLTIPQPNPLAIHSVLIQHPTCLDAVDGQIDLTVIGGTPPYAFQWNDGDTTPSQQNLAAGMYWLSITDLNSCTLVSESYLLNEPTAIELMEIHSTATSCFGTADGTLALSLSGGTAPYFFQWNTGQRDSILNHLAAGSYAVTVEDALGCTQVFED